MAIALESSHHLLVQQRREVGTPGKLPRRLQGTNSVARVAMPAEPGLRESNSYCHLAKLLLLSAAATPRSQRPPCVKPKLTGTTSPATSRPDAVSDASCERAPDCIYDKTLQVEAARIDSVLRFPERTTGLIKPLNGQAANGASLQGQSPLDSDRE